MSNHQKAYDIIKRAEEMLRSENEPHVMEWIDIVEGLKEQLKHYVYLREETEE